MQNWRKTRAPTRYSVSVLVGTTSHRATILNVNEDGAGLEGVPALAKGAAVTLQAMHHRVPAKIAWYDGGAAGVSFPTRLGPQVLATLRRLVGR